MQTEYIKHLRDELTDHAIYEKLVAQEKHAENKALLEKLAAQEKAHYEFWQNLVPAARMQPDYFFVEWIVLLRKVFGLTFAVKLMEIHEKKISKEYKKLEKDLSEENKVRFEKIVNKEIAEEKGFIAGFREKRLGYIGFIALGLSDAIVEITGVHAGFLGVTGSTLIAGIAGVIVGFAAAISMGSAAYLQAKQDPEKSPFISAMSTGISYLVSVILLAFPYFLIHTQITAFVTSSLIGMLLLALFTFYGSIVFERKFARDFGEAVALMLGTALATFILGTLVGKIFNVDVKNF